MKRHLLSVPVFAITFFLGYFVLPKLETVARESIPPAEVAYRYEPVSYPMRETTAKDEFEPEFRELPDFDDLIQSGHKLKLIDIFQHGNAYRESEVIAKNGETWLGLFEENGILALKETRTKVKLDRNYMGYGDEDYVRLTTDNAKLPLLLLKDDKSLRPGPVASYYLGPSFYEWEKRHMPSKTMSLGFKEDFEVNENFYTLRVAAGQTVGGDKVNVLVLEFGEQVEVVTYNSYFSDANTLDDTIGDLLWVGDLDRDGKLDLYLHHYGYEKGGFSSSLFLSSKADKGKLVKQVAWFGTAGC